MFYKLFVIEENLNMKDTKQFFTQIDLIIEMRKGKRYTNEELEQIKLKEDVNKTY